ncbi:MAG: hypothetical protein ACSHXH_17875 [Marivita sp.]|uniref:hypothetical protein n=1 Tax=Marivita sp. TaxID=2003365 RepID=UPI003EF3B4FF
MAIGGIGMLMTGDDTDNAGGTADGTLTDTGTTTCTGNCDYCIRLSQQIDTQAMVVQQRLEDMVLDPNDLYNTARTPADNWGSGSWEGHQDRFDYEQEILGDMIASADAHGCYVSEFARAVASESAPSRPGYD